MQAQNVMIYMLAKSGAAKELREDTLIIGFPASDLVQFNSLTAPINFNRLQAALEAERPGTRLQLIKTDGAPASKETVEKAKALFGDKLTIE